VPEARGNPRDDKSRSLRGGISLKILLSAIVRRLLEPDQENVIMRKTLHLSTAALLALSAPALADDDAMPETVVITATRTPQPLDVTGTSMSVITGDDLQTQQINVVSDALSETPGVVVSRNGGIGQTTTVTIRGAEAGQTLVLIDGVRINDPSSPDNEAVLGDLLVNNIDRIEVLRGPQSTLYGSDAIGGVIDILSKRGGAAPLALNASAEGGSFGSWHLNAAANGTAGAVDYGAAINYFDTNGISAADARNGNTETDPYRNLGATLNTRVHLSDIFSVDLRGYYTQSYTDFDGFPPPNFTFQDDPEFGTASLIAGYAGANLSLLDGRFQNRLAFIASQSDRKDFGEFDSFTNAFSPTENFFAKGDAARIEYQGTFEVNPANELVFGAETERVGLSTQSLEFDPGPTLGHKRTTGYYAQWQSRLFDQLTLTGGVRLEDDSEYGAHTSVKLAGAWQIPGWDTTLRANYGGGFKAPTLYELFSEFRNPFHALKPETAQGYEIGADHSFLDNRLRASLTWFERHTGDLIVFVDTATPPFGYYDNVERTRARGIEAEIEARPIDTLSISANWTNLSAKDLTTGLDLARRADNTASATLTWQPLPKLTAGGSVVFLGPRFDDGGNFVEDRSNTTVDLFGSYKVTDKVEVFARVENLLDELSEPIAGYGRMGRAVYGGVRTAF
jgi:vitamin B12 transporter